MRTGELNFEWDESFELELVDNRQLDVLVYSWDPQHRHKLCYRGFALLPDVLTVAPPLHQVAIKVRVIQISIPLRLAKDVINVKSERYYA